MCLVLEYVEGGDCATLIKNIGALPMDLARSVVYARISTLFSSIVYFFNSVVLSMEEMSVMTSVKS